MGFSYIPQLCFLSCSCCFLHSSLHDVRDVQISRSEMFCMISTFVFFSATFLSLSWLFLSFLDRQIIDLVWPVMFPIICLGLLFGLFEFCLKHSTLVLSPSYVPLRVRSLVAQSSRWGGWAFARSQGHLYFHSVCRSLRSLRFYWVCCRVIMDCSCRLRSRGGRA